MYYSVFSTFMVACKQQQKKIMVADVGRCSCIVWLLADQGLGQDDQSPLAIAITWLCLSVVYKQVSHCQFPKSCHLQKLVFYLYPWVYLLF